MDKEDTIEFLDAFKAISLRDSRLQLLHCFCFEAGLTRFHNSINALARWMGSIQDGVAAVYLLPTTRDADIAIAHIEANSALAALAPLVSSTSPEAKRVLVKSCQQWVGERLVGKTLALRDLVIIVDLGVGITSSYVSATAAALFTELQPKDQSPLRTFSIVVLQQRAVDDAVSNHIFDYDMVNEAVKRKAWQVVLCNTRTGSYPGNLPYTYQTKALPISDARFEDSQIAGSRGCMKGAYEQAVKKGRAGEAYKAVVLMSRSRFRRLMGTVDFSKTRSFFIGDGAPAKLVQAICEDEQPGLTVVGISTEVCIMPRMKGLRLVIADSTANKATFDIEVGQPIGRDKDVTFIRRAQLFDITHDAADLDVHFLWDGDEHQPRLSVLFPFHHTDEMFHLIIRLADICPGDSLREVPCLALPKELSVLYERVRRLQLWGLVEVKGGHTSLVATLTHDKGRIVSGLAKDESNIHSLLLLAGAAIPRPEFSAQVRHLLVWLAAVIAHGTQYVLANTEELYHVSPLSGSALAQKGGIWSAFLGLRDFSRRNDLGNEAQGPPAHPVVDAEAQQALDWVAFWVRKLSLPDIKPESTGPEDVTGRDKTMVERQLVHAFIYNIAMFDRGTTKLTDLLSETELCLGDDARAKLVGAGNRSGAQTVFAIYTDLQSSARGISPMNLTIVSDRAVYAELARIAPNPHAPPGTSPIDLEILRSRTAPGLAPRGTTASSSSAQAG